MVRLYSYPHKRSDTGPRHVLSAGDMATFEGCFQGLRPVRARRSGNRRSDRSLLNNGIDLQIHQPDIAFFIGFLQQFECFSEQGNILR